MLLFQVNAMPPPALPMYTLYRCGTTRTVTHYIGGERLIDCDNCSGRDLESLFTQLIPKLRRGVAIKEAAQSEWEDTRYQSTVRDMAKLTHVRV